MSFADESVRIERTFNAPAQVVFDAFVNPEVIADWWRPQPGWTVPAVEVDAAVGGRLLLTMRDPAGGEHLARAIFTEVDPPLRLAWIWEGDPEEAGTGSRCELDLREVEGHTEAVFLHAGLRLRGSAADFRGGWETCLENLADILG